MLAPAVALRTQHEVGLPACRYPACVAIERTEGQLDGAPAAHGGAASRFRVLQGCPAAVARGTRLLRECRERAGGGQEELVRTVRERLLHAAACPIRRPEPVASGRIACLRPRRPCRGFAQLVGLVLRRIARLAHGGVR